MAVSTFFHIISTFDDLGVLRHSLINCTFPPQEPEQKGADLYTLQSIGEVAELTSEYIACVFKLVEGRVLEKVPYYPFTAEHEKARVEAKILFFDYSDFQTLWNLYILACVIRKHKELDKESFRRVFEEVQSGPKLQTFRDYLGDMKLSLQDEDGGAYHLVLLGFDPPKFRLVKQ
jgi:hypothetical protein